MGWTHVAFLALMPFLATAIPKNLTQVGIQVCTQLDDIRKIHISFFKNDDDIEGVLILNSTYYHTGYRYPIDIDNCIFFGNGTHEDPFEIHILINVTSGDYSVLEKGTNNDISAYCPDLLYFDGNDTYSLVVKTVNDTDYHTETHIDVIYNISCGPDVLNRRIMLDPIYVHDVQVKEITSDYEVDCWIAECDRFDHNETRFYLSSSIHIICKLWFDETKLSKVGLDIRKVTYEQTSSTHGEVILVEDRCGLSDSYPWRFPLDTPAFYWEGFDGGMVDDDPKLSDNYFVTGCFKAYTFPRTKRGDVIITVKVEFELVCLSNYEEEDLLTCLNITECYSARRKRDLIENPEDGETFTSNFEITIDTEDEVLTEPTETSTKAARKVDEVSFFEQTTFAVLAGIVGLLVILLLIGGVLLFMRMRRNIDGGKGTGYENKAYS